MVAGDSASTGVTLLLVARDAATKRRWVAGLTAVLRLMRESRTRAPLSPAGNKGFGGLSNPEAWFQCLTGKSRDGTTLMLARGVPVMVAILEQGLEIRKEASGDLLAAIRCAALQRTQLTRKGLLVYVTEGLSGCPIADGGVQVLALDTEHNAEMEEQIAFIGAGNADGSTESGGGGSAAPRGLVPPSPRDIIDDDGTDDEDEYETTMQPEFVGMLPDGTLIGIGVDARGLALIELESNFVLELFDLFTIRGWGASDEQLQVVAATSDGQDDHILSMETTEGIEIVNKLKHFAEELAAQQAASAEHIEDEVGLAVGATSTSTATAGALPEGWESAVSTSTGHTYYINTVSGASTYDRPTVTAVEALTLTVDDNDSNGGDWTTLPEGWKPSERRATETNEIYYCNSETGESTYDQPVFYKSPYARTPGGQGQAQSLVGGVDSLENWPLPKDWVVRVSRSSGEQYYANDLTGVSSYERPMDLVPGEQGGPYLCEFLDGGKLGISFSNPNGTQIIVSANKAEGGVVTEGGQMAVAQILPHDVLYSIQGEAISDGEITLDIPGVKALIDAAGRPLRLVFVRPVPVTVSAQPSPSPSQLEPEPEPEPTPDGEAPWWEKEKEELGPPSPGKTLAAAGVETPVKAATSTAVSASPVAGTPVGTAAARAGPTSPISPISPVSDAGSISLMDGLDAAAADLEEPISFPMLDAGVAKATTPAGTVVLTAHTSDVYSLVLIPSTSSGLRSGLPSIASGSEDGTIRVWRAGAITDIYGAALPSNTATLQKHIGAVRALATWAQEGKRWLASGGNDKTVRVWKEETDDVWTWHQTLRGHTDEINTVRMVDGMITSGSDDMSIRLWDKCIGDEWRCVGQCKSRTLWVTAVQEIGDHSLAAADGDGGISIWSVKPDPVAAVAAVGDIQLQPKRQGSLAGHKETIWALESYQWKGTARLLASASADKSIQVWHKPRMEAENEAEAPGQEAGFKSVLKFRGPVVRRSVNALAFVTSAVDPSVHDSDSTVWDLGTEKLVFSKLRLASGGDDGKVTVWRLQYEWEFGQSWWNYSKLTTVDLDGPGGAVHSLSMFNCTHIAVGRSDGTVTLLPSPEDTDAPKPKHAAKIEMTVAPQLVAEPKVVPDRAAMGSMLLESSDEDDDDDDDDEDEDEAVVAAGRSAPSPPPTVPIKLKAATPAAVDPDRASLVALGDDSDDSDDDDSDGDDEHIAVGRAPPAALAPAPTPALVPMTPREPAPASAPAPAPAAKTVPDRATMAGLDDEDDDEDSDWDSDDGEGLTLPMEGARARSVPAAAAARAAPPAAADLNAVAMKEAAAARAARQTTLAVPDRASMAGLESDDESESSEDDG